MANYREPTPEDEAIYAAWVAERPANVREVAKRFRPWKLYRLHASDDGRPLQRVYPIAFSEPDDPDGKATVRVGVAHEFNPEGLMFQREVFGIDPDDLQECDLPPGYVPRAPIVYCEALDG